MNAISSETLTCQSPSLCQYICKGKSFDVTEYIAKLRQASHYMMFSMRRTAIVTHDVNVVMILCSVKPSAISSVTILKIREDRRSS